MIVITDKVQKTMDDDAIEFVSELRPVESGVLTNAVYADKKVTREAIAFAVIESDNVCIIIVLQIFYIDI